MAVETGRNGTVVTESLTLRLTDLDDPGSAAMRAETEDGPVEVMVIRRGERLDAYVNVCPHVSLPLDFRPGQFLDRERTHILCANHGALFRIDDGVCVSGPCFRAKLRRAHVVAEDGEIRVTGVDPDPLEI